ncbi:hypothetical protein [Amphibacillus cookii]|uniref:hypothetical protein n=1 Tax=Amphibacillus cookii TaxID=767787 RepID=UPI00195943C0|nr:hypothetical protein [Amphibacillus cookii]MBM7543267.1 hypothetical protein [Amphibacillus cookii]
MKKYFLTLFLVVSFFFVFGLGVSASESSETEQLREEFESDFLENIEKAQGEEKNLLLEEYNKYSDLSDSEKNKFVSYINDDELMEIIMEEIPDSEISMNAFSGKATETVELHKDIVSEESVEDIPAVVQGISVMSSGQTRTATYTKNVYILGIRTMQTKASMTYTRTKSGGRITGVKSYDHRITRNFTLNSWTFSGGYSRYGNTYAYSRSNVSVSLIFKGAWTYADAESEVRVDNKGNASGYLKGSLF